jgi:hypothetical protein
MDILGRVLTGVESTQTVDSSDDETPKATGMGYWYKDKDDHFWRLLNGRNRLVLINPEWGKEYRDSPWFYKHLVDSYGPLKSVEPEYYIVGAGEFSSPEPRLDLRLLKNASSDHKSWKKYFLRADDDNWFWSDDFLASVGEGSPWNYWRKEEKLINV